MEIVNPNYMFSLLVPKPIILCMLPRLIVIELSCQLYTMHKFIEIVRSLWISLQP